MKNLKVVFTVLALVAISFANAADKSFRDDEITKELSIILGAPNMAIGTQDVIAKVSFFLNTDRQIVVEKVNTPNTGAADYIKEKLNYSKLETSKLEIGKTYTVNVRIQPSL